MADKVVVHSEGSLTLEELQTTVQQNEGIIGPLCELKKDGNQNSITLEDGPAPANRAVLEAYEGTNPPDKNGYNHVCHGVCLVQGAEKQVAVYRKT